jgi:hypothetical protein
MEKDRRKTGFMIQFVFRCVHQDDIEFCGLFIRFVTSAVASIDQLPNIGNMDTLMIDATIDYNDENRFFFGIFELVELFM